MDICYCCHRPHHGVKMCDDVDAKIKKEVQECKDKEAAEAALIARRQAWQQAHQQTHQQAHQQTLPFTLQ